MGPLGNDFGIFLDGSTQGPLTISAGSTWNRTTSSTAVLGTIINNGNMIFGGGSDQEASMVVSGDTLLKGTGTVTLSNNNDGLANIAPFSGAYTLTNQSTIQGAGMITGGCGCGANGNSLALVNEGLIVANVSGQTLTVSPTSLQNVGTLRVDSGSTMILDTTTGFVTNSGNVVVKNGGTLTLASGLDYIQTGGKTTIDAGGLMQGGTFLAAAGIVTVNGVLNPTSVEIGSGATLYGSGKIISDVAMGGVIALGGDHNPGTLTIVGNYEQLAGGTFDELIGPNSNSFLNVTGDAVLDYDSFLNITLLNGYNPLGQTFDIMDYSALLGQFANGSSFWQDGYLWDVSYGQNQIDVTAVKAPEPSSFALLLAGMFALCFCSRRKINAAKRIA